MTKVYVAGSSKEIDRVETVIAALCARGVEVPGDWTVDVRAARAAGFASDRDLSPARAREAAQWCVNAVLDADVVLWLVSEVPSHGAAWEASKADSHGIDLILAGPHWRSTIFARLATLVAETDADAVDIIARGGW